MYSFTASDGSEESTAGRVVSPCSIMMHHGFRSVLYSSIACHKPFGFNLRERKKERRGVQESNNIDYAKQHHTPHCWLPAKVMYPVKSTKCFSWLTRSTSILLMMNVQIYTDGIFFLLSQ